LQGTPDFANPAILMIRNGLQLGRDSVLQVPLRRLNPEEVACLCPTTITGTKPIVPNEDTTIWKRR
jgi:hypothetical protein